MIQNLLEAFNPQDHQWMMILAGFFMAYIMARVSFPAIEYAAEVKQLTDASDKRSSHEGNVPNLGGIGIFLGLVMAITILGAVLETKLLLIVLGGLSILFFLGLKDDVLVLSASKKFMGQLLAAVLLIVFNDMRIKGLSGLFDVHVMPYWISVLLTLFVYMLIINAFNLIDGVDGLAGTLALVSSLAFGYYYLQINDMTLVVLAAALIGALLPFLRYNFSKTKKMFMGDTGSMIIGFLIAVMAVRLISISEINATNTFYIAAPSLVMAVLFFPLLDTLRIFVIRIFIHKKSPFSADRNHIHHQFLLLGYSHTKTTFTIVFINTILIVLSYACRDMSLLWQLLILIVTGSLLYAVPFVLARLGTQQKSNTFNS